MALHRFQASLWAAISVAAVVSMPRAQEAAANARAVREDVGQAGLSDADWSSLCAAYEAARQNVQECENGHRARNPQQRWTTWFDGRGFTTTPDAGGWVWGLELASFGRGGAERLIAGSARVDVDGTRVTYEWGDALDEWYVNDHRGVEHGYTIHAPPGGRKGEPLVFTLAVRGGLRAEVSEDGRSVAFVSEGGVAAVTYAGLTVIDAGGRDVPARFVSAAEVLRLTVEDGDALYPLTVDPIAQQAYLSASNYQGNDDFGRSISASGDTVVVGAELEDGAATGVNGNQSGNGANDSGAAYVFVRTESGWSQQAYLKASNTGPADEFGFSVSISGDTIVVGAPGEDSSATGVNGNQSDESAPNSGAVYVFVRNGDVWSQEAYLKASNTGTGDWFGWSVSICEDTIVVGASSEDSSATGVGGDQSDNVQSHSGAAYVFVRSGTTWNQEAYLKASTSHALASFGTSVSISDDTVVCGAPHQFGAGAAFVYVRDGGIWSPEAYLKASNVGGDDYFGTSVSISGDLLVVGAPGEDSDSTGVNGDQNNEDSLDAGAAYVFGRNGTNWSQQAYLKASNTEPSASELYKEYFGSSVAISGEIVVVGAPLEDSAAVGVNGNQADDSAQKSGAAYLFVRSQTEWTQWAYLKASNTGAGDQFGTSVTIAGDTVAVGAIYEDKTLANNSGAAYVYTLPCGAITHYGAGCAGTGGFVPDLSLTGCATVGQKLTMEITEGPGGAPVVLLLGAEQTSQTIGGGCTLLVLPLLQLPGIFLDGGGAGDGSVTLLTTLGSMTSGITTTIQAAIADAGSPLGFTLTNAVQLDVQ